MTSENVGDVNSSARGSGARFNAGKTRLDLLPLNIVLDSLPLSTEDMIDTVDDSVRTAVYRAMSDIGHFQQSGDELFLDRALDTLHPYWKDCADVFEYGAKKYASWNWVKGMAWSIPIGCIGRHSFAVFNGEMNDPESGLPHVGHILCNVVMLKTYFEGYPEGNDLPPKYFRIDKIIDTKIEDNINKELINIMLNAINETKKHGYDKEKFKNEKLFYNILKINSTENSLILKNTLEKIKSYCSEDELKIFIKILKDAFYIL
jgi:hypothetical protein